MVGVLISLAVEYLMVVVVVVGPLPRGEVVNGLRKYVTPTYLSVSSKKPSMHPPEALVR